MAPKTIILTGGSRGIGLAIAEFVLKGSERHNLIVIGRSKDALENLKSQAPKQVEVISGDLADFSLGQKAVNLAISSFGRLDGLIINHGTMEPVARITDSDPTEWRQAFDINFFSAVACVKAAIPELRKSKGCILFTSSGAAVSTYSAWGAYGASKAAINHLALTLKAEEPEITTLSIRPGVVDTGMQQDIRKVHLSLMDEADRKKFVDAHKNGKLLRPDQPGNVMARLVLNPPKELSGKFLSWNDEAFKAFQD